MSPRLRLCSNIVCVCVCAGGRSVATRHPRHRHTCADMPGITAIGLHHCSNGRAPPLCIERDAPGCSPLPPSWQTAVQVIITRLQSEDIVGGCFRITGFDTEFAERRVSGTAQACPLKRRKAAEPDVDFMQLFAEPRQARSSATTTSSSSRLGGEVADDEDMEPSAAEGLDFDDLSWALGEIVGDDAMAAAGIMGLLRNEEELADARAEQQGADLEEGAAVFDESLTGAGSASAGDVLGEGTSPAAPSAPPAADAEILHGPRIARTGASKGMTARVLDIADDAGTECVGVLHVVREGSVKATCRQRQARFRGRGRCSALAVLWQRCHRGCTRAPSPLCETAVWHAPPIGSLAWAGGMTQCGLVQCPKNVCARPLVFAHCCCGIMGGMPVGRTMHRGHACRIAASLGSCAVRRGVVFVRGFA